jgi:hypothetical protein
LFAENCRPAFAHPDSIKLGRNVSVSNAPDKEGVSACNEAIEFLLRQPARSPCTFSEAISKASRDLCLDQGPIGLVGHADTRGGLQDTRISRYGDIVSMSSENCYYNLDLDPDLVVALWVIDDDVPSRGHRTGLFHPQNHLAGIAVGPHITHGHVVVIDWCDDLRPFPS